MLYFVALIRLVALLLVGVSVTYLVLWSVVSLRKYQGRLGGENCGVCGYAMKGIVGLVCPECGTSIAEMPRHFLRPPHWFARVALTIGMSVLLWSPVDAWIADHCTVHEQHVRNTLVVKKGASMTLELFKVDDRLTEARLTGPSDFRVWDTLPSLEAIERALEGIVPVGSEAQAAAELKEMMEDPNSAEGLTIPEARKRIILTNSTWSGVTISTSGWGQVVSMVLYFMILGLTLLMSRLLVSWLICEVRRRCEQGAVVNHLE